MNALVDPRKALILVGLLFACTGCRESRSPGEAEAPAEHAGHVIPAHKPKDFRSAVHRLRGLNDQITSKLAEGPGKALMTEKTLPIALDIANWLPEIAADSDMPEAPWDQVNDRSAALVADYRRILEDIEIDASLAEASASAKNADTSIDALEQLLNSADPRWFECLKPGAHR